MNEVTVKVHESQLEEYLVTKVWNEVYSMNKEWDFYNITIYFWKPVKYLQSK